MKIEDLGEFGLIDRIKQIVDTASEKLITGIDDDAAVFKSTGARLTLLTTDMLIEGVHFDLSCMTLYHLGWRAMAANLSDIAAMGGLPSYAVVSIGVPRRYDVEPILNLYRGIKDLADKFKTLIVGGDTSHSPDRLLVSIAVIGEVEKNKLTLRSGARIGDAIFVTGILGGAQVGLKILQHGDKVLKDRFELSVKKHLTPAPRIKEARFLVEHFPIHAMIDVSDGLASEVNHVCRHSQTGAVVVAERVPLDLETRNVAQYFDDDPLTYALAGGEDFELLFTAPEEIANELQSSFHKQFGFACTKIGDIKTKAEGIKILHPQGQLSDLGTQGFDHFRK